MNIYEKLQTARIELQNTSLKKSGNNKFAGYDYFELGDFLPAINTIMLKNKMSSFINFNSDLAILTIVNSEKPDEQIQFTSPMSSASLKGCHDVQNLGAVQTYLRRYLYVNAFEIVEHDALDAVHGSDSSKNDYKPSGERKDEGNTNTLPNTKLSDKQVNRAIVIGKSKGITLENIKKHISVDYGKTEIADLTKEQYDKLCTRLENAGGVK